MGKVITGATLQEFISEGKVQEIKSAVRKETQEAPALEVKAEVNEVNAILPNRRRRIWRPSRIRS